MDSTSRPSLFQRYMNGSLVLQIIIGIVCGIAIATFSPSAAQSAGLLGNLFVKALKAIAPLLVFVLVMASIANHKQNEQTFMGKRIKWLILPLHESETDRHLIGLSG